MIKRLLSVFFIYIFIALIPCNNSINTFIRGIYPFAAAEEVLKINSINFDNSDSIIFLGTSASLAVEDIKIEKQILNEPDRVFFDIENAVITFPNATYELKNSKLQKVVIAQNSVSPNVVRIVIWNSPSYDTSQIKVLKIKNNIIIKLNNEIPKQKYLTQTYKETKGSAIDYNDNTVAIQQEIKQQPKEVDEIFNKVQQAFKEDNQELVRPNIEQKQAKLKSRFFLENANVKNGGLLISGIGVINVEKPFTLTEPSRIVFDLPNTIVSQELRDKEFKLFENVTAKIGQFESSKARIVIRTDSPNNYRPIYSSNLQSLFISPNYNISGINVTPVKSQLTYFKEEAVNENTNVVNILFSNPVVYSIQRINDKFHINIYNIINFDTASFNNIAVTNETGFEAKRISSEVYRISFPVNSSIMVDCYEALNASQLRLIFTKKKDDTSAAPLSKSLPSIKIDNSELANIPVQMPEKPELVRKEIPFDNLIERSELKKSGKLSKKNKTEQAAIKKIKDKVIVIDPGHGGNDTGAMRAGVLEKELTLAIALKIRDMLKEKGMQNVIMTRSDDKTLTLVERVETANNNNADIFVSIHINASVKSEINGLETHYYSEKGFDVAKVLHTNLIEQLNTYDRGLFKSKFYVINHTEAPAVLLELGFISNEQERKQLEAEKRQTISAQAIADGIIKYLLEY